MEEEGGGAGQYWIRNRTEEVRWWRDELLIRSEKEEEQMERRSW